MLPLTSNERMLLFLGWLLPGVALLARRATLFNRIIFRSGGATAQLRKRASDSWAQWPFFPTVRTLSSSAKNSAFAFGCQSFALGRQP